jgi:hypothetical protein
MVLRRVWQLLVAAMFQAKKSLLDVCLVAPRKRCHAIGYPHPTSFSRRVLRFNIFPAVRQTASKDRRVNLERLANVRLKAMTEHLSAYVVG